MKEKKINEKGITLVALVITIIVLIILVVISINLIFGENGIVAQAKNAEEKQKIAEILEKLEMEKSNVVADKKELNLENYLVHIENKNMITKEDIEETDSEDISNILIEGYVFSITDLNNGNVIIKYEGKGSELLPLIDNIAIKEITEDSITIEVTATRMEKGTYKYYIKNITEKGEYELKEETEENTYTFTGLDSETTYKIQVEAINENGSKEKETEEITTEEPEEEVVYTYSYKGSHEKVTLPAGTYKIEAWGAQGASAYNGSTGGKGGYSTGILTLTSNTTLYIYTGGSGKNGSGSGTGGFNGGGLGYGYGSYGSGGGGASDIRIGSTSLYARVIVAGGGGRRRRTEI